MSTDRAVLSHDDSSLELTDTFTAAISAVYRRQSSKSKLARCDRGPKLAGRCFKLAKMFERSSQEAEHRLRQISPVRRVLLHSRETRCPRQYRARRSYDDDRVVCLVIVAESRKAMSMFERASGIVSLSLADPRGDMAELEISTMDHPRTGIVCERKTSATRDREECLQAGFER